MLLKVRQISKLSLYIGSLLLIGFSFTGCDSSRVYDDYQSLKNAEWHRDSLVRFSFNIEDTTASYNMHLGLRNRGDYSNQNIWLFVEVESPKGIRSVDTVEFYLAEVSGKWLGKGIGDLYDCRFLYKENVFFPDTGAYKMNIRQGMRYEVLEGINDIGLRVEYMNE